MGKFKKKKYIGILGIVALVLAIIGIVVFGKFDKYKGLVKLKNVTVNHNVLSASISNVLDQPNASKGSDVIKYEIRYTLEPITGVETRNVTIRASLSDEESKYARFKAIRGTGITSSLTNNGKEIEVNIQDVPLGVENIIGLKLIITNAPNGFSVKPNIKIKESTSSEETIVSTSTIVVTTRTIEGTVYDQYNLPLSNIELSLNDETGEIKRTYTDENGKYIFSDIENKQYSVKIEEEIYELVGNNTITDQGILDLNVKEVKPYDIETHKYISKLDLVVNGKEQHYEYNNLETVVQNVKNAKTIGGKITYRITIKNIGDKSGKLSILKDKVDNGLKFDKAKNPGWSLNDGNLYYDSINSVTLNKGETREIILVLDIIDTKELKTYINEIDVNGETYENVVYILDGVKYREESVILGEKIVEPTVQDETFSGWYTDRNLTNKYNFNNPVTKDLILYGNTEIITHRVEFYDKNPETGIETKWDEKEVQEGKKVSQPSSPSHEGYDFECWMDEHDNVWNFNNPVTRDMRLTSCYTIKKYNVVFMDGDQEYNRQLVNYKGSINVPADPTKQYHTFKFWHLEGYNSAYNLTTPVTQDVTLYAKYERNKHDITFVDKHPSTLEEVSRNTVTVDEGDLLTRPTDPTKTGYNFKCWVKSNNECFDFENPVVSDEELTSSYEIIEYTISYAGITDAEKLALNNPIKYTVEDTFTLTNPSNRLDGDGDLSEIFVGWTGSNGNDPSTTITISKGTTGNKNYTANWIEADPDVYPITYKLNGGTLGKDNEGHDITNPSSYTKKTNDFTLNNPKKKGYSFTGWSGTDLVGNENTTVTIVKGSRGERSYEAFYTPVNYSIEYENTCGVVQNPDSYTIETPDITLNNPSKAGYTFTGWITEDDSTKVMNVTIAQGSTGNRKYIATCEPIVYHITYDLQGGSLQSGKTNPETYTIESSDITLNNPSKAHYTFEGWTGTDLLDKTATVIIPTGSMGDREYTANYQIITHTVSFKDKDPENPSLDTVTNFGEPVIVNDGNTVSQPVTNPEHTGYICDKWSTKLDGNYNTDAYDFSTEVTSDLTLYTLCKKKSYTVTFMDGSNQFALQNVLYKEFAIKPIPDPDHSSENKIFLNWTLNDTAYDFSTEVTDNIVLHSSYELVEEPVITHTPTEWTNQDVTVTITNKGTVDKDYTGYSYKYREDDAIKDYTTEFTVSENKDIYATAYKSGVSSIEVKHEIRNIDKIKPIINSVDYSTVTTDSFVLEVSSKDNESGLNTINIYNGETLLKTINITSDYNETHTESVLVDGLDPNTTYTLGVTSKDRAGNISDKETIVVTTSDVDRIVAEIIAYNNVPFDPADYIPLRTLRMGIEYNQGGIDCTTNQCTIQMLENVNESNEILDGQDITLNLNGKTITGVREYTFNNNGKFKVIDTTEEESYDIYDTSNYVTNGLGLFLDGINHGHTSGKWNDLSNDNSYNIVSANWNAAGNGLVFDGTSKYVPLGEMNPEVFTFEIVFEDSNVASTTEQILGGNIQSGGYAIFVKNGNLSVDINDGSWVVLSTPIIDNQKYVATMTYDGSTLSLYVNGQFVASKPAGNIVFPANSTELMLGTNPNGSQPGGGFANGTIYGARLYNRVLTADEIQNNYIIDYNRYVRTNSGSSSEPTDPGAIINTTDTAIINTGILNVGVNDTALNVSETKPYIEGANTGVRSDGTFNFYDGKIKAVNAIKGRVYDTPEGYNANAVVTEEGGVDYQIATLKILADVEARIDYVYYTRISGAVSEAKDNTNNGVTTTTQFGKGFVTPGSYGFVLDEENNVITSNNNIEGTEAYSYTTIDLRESPIDQEFYVSGRIDSANLNLDGTTIESGTISIKTDNGQGTSIKYCTFNTTTDTVCNVNLEAGKNYYVELRFTTNSESDTTTTTNSKFIINEMALKEAEMVPTNPDYISTETITEPVYSFDYDSSTKTLKSNNSYVPESTAHSYYELDLTSSTVDKQLIVRASLDTLYTDNIGAIMVSEDSNINQYYSNSSNNFARMQLKDNEAGFIGPMNYTKTLTKGKKYYLHVFYYKSNDPYTQTDYEAAGVSDQFIINSIDLVGLTSGTENLTDNFKSYSGTSFSRYEYSPYYYYTNNNTDKLTDSFVMIDMRDKSSDAYVNINAYLDYYGGGSVAPKYIYLSTTPGNADLATIEANKEKTILYNEYNTGYNTKDGSSINDRQNDYGVYLPKGTVYYLHFGQYGKNGNSYDTSRIYSINLTYITSNDFKVGKNINLINTTFDGDMGQGTGDTDNYVVDDGTADKNFRYIGSSANNYVDFNGTKWRIVGVFNTVDRNGNEDRRIKLISYNYDNYASWDSSPQVESGGTSPGNSNYGNGINEWSQADVMKLMNPGYENNEEETFYMSGSTPVSNGTRLVNNSLMWTASDQSSGYSYGYYFYGSNNTTYSSSFYASNSLNATIKPFIDEVVWYTGAYVQHPAGAGQTVYDMYNVERGSYTGNTGCTKDTYAPADNVERTTSWIGKVGLLYPTDYYMASGSISGLSRSSCMSHAGTCQSCISGNNWLYSGSSYSNMWFISPSNGFSGTETSSSPYMVTRAYGNYMSITNAANTAPVYPSVYLSPKTKVVSGQGTYSNPYVFELGEEKNTLRNYGLDGESEHTPVVETTDLETEGTDYSAFKTVELYDFSFDSTTSTYISENTGKKYSKAERIEKIDLTNASEDVNVSVSVNYSAPGTSLAYVLLSERKIPSYDDISGPRIESTDEMYVDFYYNNSSATNQLYQKDVTLEKGKVYYLQMKYYKKNALPVSTDYTDSLKVRFGVKNYSSSTSNYESYNPNYIDLNSTDTVTMVRNITTNYSVTIPETKALTLDLNGYTLTNSAPGYVINNKGNLSIIDTKYQDDMDASDEDYQTQLAINQAKYQQALEDYNAHKDDDLGFTPDYSKFTGSTCSGSNRICTVTSDSEKMMSTYKNNAGTITYSTPFVSTYGIERISLSYRVNTSYSSGTFTIGIKKNGSSNFFAKKQITTSYNAVLTGDVSFDLTEPGNYTLVVTTPNTTNNSNVNISNLQFTIEEPTMVEPDRIEPTHFGKVRGTTTNAIYNAQGAYLEVKQGVVEIGKAGTSSNYLAAINNYGTVKVCEDGKILAKNNYNIGIRNYSSGDILPGEGTFESGTAAYPIYANSSVNRKIKGYTFDGGYLQHKNNVPLELSNVTFKGFPITPIGYNSNSSITVIDSTIIGNPSSSYGSYAVYLTNSATYGGSNTGEISFINDNLTNLQYDIYVTYAPNRKINLKNMNLDSNIYANASNNNSSNFILNLNNVKENKVNFTCTYGTLNINKGSDVAQLNLSDGYLNVDDSKMTNACLFVSKPTYIKNSEVTNLNNRSGSSYTSSSNLVNSKVKNLINTSGDSSYCSGVSGSSTTNSYIVDNSEIEYISNGKPLTVKNSSNVETLRNDNTASVIDSNITLLNNSCSTSSNTNPVVTVNNSTVDTLRNQGRNSSSKSTATLLGDTVVNNRILSNTYSSLTLGENDGTINNNLIINGGIDASDVSKNTIFNYYDGKLIGTLDETLIGGIDDIATDHDILSTISGDTETITLVPIDERPSDNYVASIGGTKYTSLQDAFDAVPEGSENSTTITLLQDIKTAVSNTFAENKKAVLDVAGFKIWNFSKANDSIINKGDISFANSNNNDNYSRTYGAGILNNEGTADVNNIIMTRLYNNYPLLINSGIMTVNGGEVNSNSNSTSNNDSMIVNSGDLTINAGTFRGCNYDGAWNIVNTNNLTINGGTFVNSSQLVLSGASDLGANLNVTDGTFNFKGTAFNSYGTANITGGTYGDQVSLINTNGSADVTSTTLVEGITAPILRIGSISSNSTETIKDCTFATLNLTTSNNGNLIVDNSTLSSINTLINSTGNNTIKDSTLTAPKILEGTGSLFTEGSVLNATNTAVTLTSGDHITVKDGTIYSENAEAIKAGTDVITLGVKGDEDSSGNLNLSTTDPEVSGKTYGINVTGSNSQIHFYDGIVKGQNAIAGSVLDVEDGYEIIVDSDVRGEAKYLGVKPVIRNLTTHQDYYDIQLAVDESNPGDTLQLLREVTLRANHPTITIDQTKNVTIDLAGFKLIHSNPKLFINNGELKLTNSSAVVGTTSDGHIQITGEGCIYNSGSSVIIENNEILTVEAIEIMDTTDGVIIENNGGLTVKDAILQDNVGGEVIVNNEQATIQNSIITDKTDEDYLYSYQTKFIKNLKNITITDSEFYGKGILTNVGSTSVATMSNTIINNPTNSSVVNQYISRYAYREFDNEGTLNLNDITVKSTAQKEYCFLGNTGTVNVDTMTLNVLITGELFVNSNNMDIKDLTITDTIYSTNRVFYNTGTLTVDNVNGQSSMLLYNNANAEIINSNYNGAVINGESSIRRFIENTAGSSLSFEDSTFTVSHTNNSKNDDNIWNNGTLSLLRTDYTSTRSGTATEERSLIHSNGTVTIDGGTFTANSERFMLAYNSAVTISNATINAFEGVITESVNNSTTNVTLNNNTVSTTAFAVAERQESNNNDYESFGEYSNSSVVARKGTVITINGGSYTSQNNFVRDTRTKPPLIMMTGGTLNVTSGTFNGTVQSYGSVLNLEDGTFTKNKRTVAVDIYYMNNSTLNIGKKGDLDTNSVLKVSNQTPSIEGVELYGRTISDDAIIYTPAYYRVSDLNFYDGRVKQIPNYSIFKLEDILDTEDGYNIVCSTEDGSEYCYPSNEGVIENTSTGTKYVSFTDAINNAASGDTLKVVGTGSGSSIIAMNTNGTSGTTINSGETYTIDLNGFTVSMIQPFVTNNGTLNIDDTSTNKYGKIYKGPITNTGTLNVNNGNVEVENSGTTTVDNTATVSIENTGTLDVNNGSVTMKSNSGTVNQTGGLLKAEASSAGSTITTSGGTVKLGKIRGDVTVTGGTTDIIDNNSYSYGTISITNATINNLPNNYGTMNIDHSSGVFNAKNKSGGTSSIVDSTITGRITSTGGTTTINNCIFDNAVHIKNDGGTINLSNSNGTFTDSIIKSTAGTTNILNGSYETTGNYGIEVSGGIVVLGTNDGSVSTNTPKFTANKYGIYQTAGSVRFFDGRVGGKDASIFGAIAQTELGYKIVNTTIDDVIYGVLAIDETVPKVAMVNGVNYYTLQSAINACGENETTDVILYANIILDDDIVVRDNVTVDLYLNNFTIDYGSYGFTGNGTVNVISGAPAGLGGAIYKFLANVTGSPINPIDITIYQMEDGSSLLSANIYKLYKIDGTDYKVIKVVENEIGNYNLGNKTEELRTTTGTININNIGNGSYKLVGSDGKELEFGINDGVVSSNITKNIYGSKANIKSSAIATLILQLQTGTIRYPFILIIMVISIITLSLIAYKKTKKESYEE